MRSQLSGTKGINLTPSSKLKDSGHKVRSQSVLEERLSNLLWQSADRTNRDIEADYDLSSIEEILRPLLQKEIAADRGQNSAHTHETSESRVESRWDGAMGGSQGTRGMRVSTQLH